jgi:ribonuclease J
MPIHGEYRHLKANAALATSTGVPADRVIIAEDGVVVDLDRGRARIAGAVEAGYVYVDAMTVGGVTEANLKDRRALAEEGVVTVVLIVDAHTGRLAEPPDFLARGFVHDDTTFKEVVPVIEDTLARAAKEGIGDANQLEELVGRAVGNWTYRHWRRRPVVIPVVIDA